MAPEDEPITTPGTAEPVPVADGPRDGRRSSRGHRGRGRRHKRKSPQAERAPQQDQVRADPGRDEPSPAEPATAAAVDMPPPEPLPEPVREEAPASRPPVSSEQQFAEPPANLQEAIDQVNQVVESLRVSLEEMEEVLELLETLERQTSADQREIDSLRRALRQLHRPREGGREGGHGHGPSR